MIGGLVAAAATAAIVTKIALAPAAVYDGPALERDPYYFYLANHAELVDRAAEIYEAGYARAHNPEFLLAEGRMYLQFGDCAAFPLLARYSAAGGVIPREMVAVRDKYTWICNSPYGMHDADDFEKKAELDMRINPMMAIPEFREAARMAPNRAELWYKLAETEQSMGYCTLARQHFERFLRTLPTEAARVEERTNVEAALERCEPSDVEMMPDFRNATPLVPPP
jgi:tetratricopeptide (TPR) repeat protein